MRAALGDGLDSTSREGKSDGLLELRHVDALLLEVWVLPHHAGGVELGSASPVGVASTDL